MESQLTKRRNAMSTRNESKSEKLISQDTSHLSSSSQLVPLPTISLIPIYRSAGFFQMKQIERIKERRAELLDERRWNLGPYAYGEERRIDKEDKRLERQLKELLFEYNVLRLPKVLREEIGKFLYGERKKSKSNLINRK